MKFGVDLCAEMIHVRVVDIRVLQLCTKTRNVALQKKTLILGVPSQLVS
jgi:hypothetical protein